MISILICILIFMFGSVLFYFSLRSIADNTKEKIFTIIVSMFLSALITAMVTFLILLYCSESTVKNKPIATYDISEETEIIHNVVYSYPGADVFYKTVDNKEFERVEVEEHCLEYNPLFILYFDAFSLDTYKSKITVYKYIEE